MKKLVDLKIGTKLIIALSIIFVFVIGFSIYLIFRVVEYSNQVENLIESQNQIRISKNLQIRVSNIWQFYTDAAVTRNYNVITEQVMQNFVDARKYIDELIKVNVNDEKTKKYLEKILKDLYSMDKLGNQMYFAYDSSSDKGNDIMDHYDRVGDTIIANVDSLVHKIDMAQLDQIVDLRAETKYHILLTIISALSIVLICSIMIVFMAKSQVFERFRSYLEFSPIPSLVVDKNGSIRFVNNAYYNLFGENIQESAKKVLETFLFMTKSKNVDKTFLGNLPYDKKSIGLIMRDQNGNELNMLIDAAKIDNKNYIIHFLDITEHLHAEEMQSRLQKLESIGNLAGGIAHEFNNLFTSLFGFIEIAKNESNDDNVIKNLDKAMNSMGRGQNLTQQLLTFARGGAPVRKTEQLMPLIQETVESLLRDTNISYTIYIPEMIWSSRFDKNQISQVIQNIVINAKDSMLSGGSVEISAKNMIHKKQENSVLSDGNFVKISFKDNGKGISEDILPRIFDPFFTTDSPRKTGLGLSICHSIIKQHDGCIEVESGVGKGSIFHVYLPAITEPENETS